MKNIFDDISGRVTHESYIYICPPGKTKVNIKKMKKRNVAFVCKGGPSDLLDFKI